MSCLDFVQKTLNVNLLFHFEHNHIKNIITIKKKKKKREEEKERLKYFKKYNIKKYCDKKKFQHFSLNVFEDSRIIRKFFLNT